ncbi:MAG: hypothetical protein P8L85_07530 [Rubripirellula sp.]|nr:hypothetical protein [Rubripirellula sp.]
MMSEIPFDPYHKWLGIPSAEQPANHYRLLGIPLFEQDEDVIENAATRQIEYLRTFAVGPNAEDSQKLLNEVALAKVTLLNPPEKHVYDQALKDANGLESQPEQQGNPPLVAGTDEVSGKTSSVEKAGTNMASESLLEFDSLFAAAPTTHSPFSTVRKRSSTSDSKWLLHGGVLVGSLVIVSVVAIFLYGKEKTDSRLAAESRAPAALDPVALDPGENPQGNSSQQQRESPQNGMSKRSNAERESTKRALGSANNRAVDQRTEFVRLYVLVNSDGNFNFNVIVSEEEMHKRRELFSDLGKDLTQGEFLGYAATEKRPGLVPLYRYRTAGAKRYLFCKERRTGAGSQREKLLGWVSPTPCENGATIFRLRETKRNRRRITTNVTVRDQRVAVGDDMSDGPLAYTFIAPRLPDRNLSP